MAEFESLFFSTWDEFPWNGPKAENVHRQTVKNIMGRVGDIGGGEWDEDAEVDTWRTITSERVRGSVKVAPVAKKMAE